MIGYLKGTIAHNDDKFVLLDVSGVGYKIYTNTSFINTEKEVCFWTHLAVRENALDLYGFQTKEEMDFFELLITVSGIGPKSALSIMTLATLKNLRQAIKTGDVGHLVKVSGVGKKNAEKIVLELKDKIGDVELASENVADMDALEALKSLGYNEKDVREALKKLSDISDTGDKVRKALKLLS